jgi:hypothetical protein
MKRPSDPEYTLFDLPKQDAFLNCQEILRRPAWLENWGKLWVDVREDCPMLGEERMTDALAYVAYGWVTRAAVVVEPSGKKDEPPKRKPFVPPYETWWRALRERWESCRRDLVEEYLLSLPAWDEVSRMEDLCKALGLDAASDAGPIELVFVRKFLISAVARALSPGCKADCALVLIGGQGLGKSTSVAELFGREFTHESALNLEDKDGQSVMGSAWCVELAELASVRRASDVEAVKHFLSICHDSYRPSYGRIKVTIPRRAVCVGTTNDTEPFADPTGSRRFWPAAVDGARIDLGWIRAHRSEIWAEAVSLYRKGEQWWLTQEEEVERVRVSECRQYSDPWLEVIRDLLDERTETSMNDLLASVGVPVERQGVREMRRAGHIMRQLGWEKVNVSESGKQRKLWRKIAGDGVGGVDSGSATH